jgi:hypothetical protein
MKRFSLKLLVSIVGVEIIVIVLLAAALWRGAR